MTCNLFQPGVFGAPGQIPQYTQYAGQHGRLQDRLEQLRAERERRVAAERAVGPAADAAGRSRSRPRCAPATPWPTTATAWPSSRTSSAATRAASHHGQPEQQIGNLVPAGEAWPLLYPRDEPPRTAAGLRDAGTAGGLHPRRAGLPDARDDGHQREHLRSGDSALVHELVHGRLPAGAVARTWRSKSATSARRTATAGRRRTGTRSTSTRTASSTSSSWRRPTCARTSRRAAARRASRPAASPIAGPAPARRRCRSIWRISTRRTAPTPATPRSTPAPTGRTRRSSAGSTRSNRRRRQQQRLERSVQQRDVPHQHGRRPACRRTSG